MGLLLAFLKMLGTAAAKGAAGLGKAALTGAKVGAEALGKGATEAGKWGWNRATQGAKADTLSPNKLVEAFGSLIAPNAEAAQQQAQTPNVDLGRIVVPGPGGRPIQGMGEAMPGYEMQPPNYRIPPAYLQMGQPQAQQVMQQPSQQVGKYPGIFAGIKEGLLGIPSTAGQPQPSEKGRQTAYYAGKLIPDIMRSKMGVSTTGEEARQQQMIEAYKTKEVTPEYKKDLQEATIRLSNPNLSEQDKIMIYQQLVTVYPERSAEIKRIIFPQSSDNFSDLLSGIIAGYGGGVNAR